MKRQFDDKPIAVPPDEHGILLWRINNEVYTNVPHLVVHHSPSGFEFSYGGSGPADLALNILEWLLRKEGYAGNTIKCFDGKCFRLAWNLHQEFKREVIATCDRNNTELRLPELESWLAAHRPSAETPRQWPDSSP